MTIPHERKKAVPRVAKWGDFNKALMISPHGIGATPAPSILKGRWLASETSQDGRVTPGKMRVKDRKIEGLQLRRCNIA